MAIPLVVNGQTFEYPVDFDENWGVNATGWAQAVTNGMLQRAGGNFPLTADVNFGASFGLVSLYYKSRSTPIATTGTLRLASADPGIAFRNNANSANLVLTTNSSDRLVYPGGLELTGTLLLHDDNAIGFQDTGSVHTINMKAPTTTANYTITLPPNSGSSGQVLSTDGAGTTTWINASGTGTINSGTQYQFTYYATTGTTLSGNSSITTNASNQLLVTNGTVSLPAYSFTSDPDTGIYRVGANDIAISTGGTNRLEVSSTGISATLPLDMGSNAITTSGNISFGNTSTQGIVGTTTNDTAAAGNVGEYSIGVSVLVTTGTTTWVNTTIIALTAGDWDVSGVVSFAKNTSNYTDVAMAISVNSGNTTTDQVEGNNQATFSTTGSLASLSIPNYRLSIVGLTFVYLKSRPTFSTGSYVYSSRLSARRIR